MFLLKVSRKFWGTANRWICENANPSIRSASKLSGICRTRPYVESRLSLPTLLDFLTLKVEGKMLKKGAGWNFVYYMEINK